MIPIVARATNNNCHIELDLIRFGRSDKPDEDIVQIQVAKLCVFNIYYQIMVTRYVKESN